MFKLKFAGAVIAAFLPCNWMRVLAYRLLLGYKIEGAQIGFGTLIAGTSTANLPVTGFWSEGRRPR